MSRQKYNDGAEWNRPMGSHKTRIISLFIEMIYFILALFSPFIFQSKHKVYYTCLPLWWVGQCCFWNGMGLAVLVANSWTIMSFSITTLKYMVHRPFRSYSKVSSDLGPGCGFGGGLLMDGVSCNENVRPWNKFGAFVSVWSICQCFPPLDSYWSACFVESLLIYLYASAWEMKERKYIHSTKSHFFNMVVAKF